jgi:SAM-dependent methyltransferase
MYLRPCDDESIAYYEDHAQDFFGETVSVDLSPLYARFLPHVPAGGHILDVGCGSGRDVRAFRAQGYTVTGFDPSPTLARLATAHCGLPVQVLRVQEIDWHRQFDGIWACASLLHVPAAELPEVLRRLAAALKAGGVLYASFKYGQGKREHGGRNFTDLDEAGLAALLRAVPCFTEFETWTTGDRRPGREDERWLNTVLVAKPQMCLARSDPGCRLA